jgi:hypothetical protein
MAVILVDPAVPETRFGEMVAEVDPAAEVVDRAVWGIIFRHLLCSRPYGVQAPLRLHRCSSYMLLVIGLALILSCNTSESRVGLKIS